MVSCGHSSPDNEKTSWKSMKDTFESASNYNIHLEDNNSVNGSINN